GRLVKRFGEAKLAFAGFVAAGFGYALLGFATSVAMIVVTATINAFGNGVLRPVLTSQMSQAVGPHEQGIAIGISGSLSSFAMTIAPPTGGAFINADLLAGWALVSATAASLGLVALLATRGRTTTPAGTSSKAALDSAG